MSFWSNLFKSQPKVSTKGVDWLRVEGKLRELEQMALLTDQATTKQLIIQSDVLVDSILKEARIAGQTMGERLRSLQSRMEKADYSALWQGHNKRNELVHESASFVADWEKTKYFAGFKQGIRALRSVR